MPKNKNNIIKIIVTMSAALLILIPLTGCIGSKIPGITPTTKSEGVSQVLQNTISVSGAGDIIGSILIEGNIEKDTEFDKASVTITKETRVFESKSGKLIKASFDSLKPNQRVQALFTGPVMESYPVQVKAKEVVILE